MKGNKLRAAALGLVASSLLSTVPASAQVGGGSPTARGPCLRQRPSRPSTASSSRKPIWFRGAESAAAIAQLVSILQRAPFDGLAAGPQLAAQVQAAVAQASSGKPDDVAAAEQTLSAAWVQYVQALKRPTPGMDLCLSVPEAAGHSRRSDPADRRRGAVARAPSGAGVERQLDLRPDPRRGLGASAGFRQSAALIRGSC